MKSEKMRIFLRKRREKVKQKKKIFFWDMEKKPQEMNETRNHCEKLIFPSDIVCVCVCASVDR